ncbi:MAG: hypothetical protein GY714_13160 [Desulfobacterales bacterium]|nr:hypothetical protein [Desulfobacterales bacterium]
MDFINNLYGDIFDRIFKLILLLPVAVILFSLAAYFVKKSGWYKHIFISASQWIISIPYVKQLANYTPKNINERVVKLKSWILGISGTLLFSCFVLVGIRIEINDTLNDLLITGITFFAGIYIFIELIFYRYKTIRDDKYKNYPIKLVLKNY